MTQKEFRQMLLKGRGSCVQAVRTEPDRYRNQVLWACSHEISFDPQCEGSRAWYVYQMIECYEDKSPFLNTLIGALDKSRSNGGWKLQYIAEILMHFVLDGYSEADAALWRKYEELYSQLRSRIRLPPCTFPQRDDFELLCVDLGERRDAMVKIAEDIGRLYRENPIYGGWDFDWLYAHNGKKYLKTMERLSKKSENIAEYLRVSREYEEERRTRENRQPSARLLSRRLAKEGNSEKIRECTEDYLREADPEARAKALQMFSQCPYPGDPAPIIEDTRSENSDLRFIAWHVLENMRHPQVREFALAHMEEDPEKYFPLLVRNYDPTDASNIMEMVTSVPTDHACTTIWHGLHLDVLDMEKYGLKAPKELLAYIVETTYCPNCRYNALRQMGRRRMLTREILEECLFDSNDDIRDFAKRCMKRRKAE